jgi:hypothetical protein
MKLGRIIVAILLLGIFLIPAYASAQESPLFKNICQHNRQSGNENSTVCEDASQSSGANPLYGPRGIITIVVNLLSLVVGIAAVIGIIVAGIKFLTSASNPEEANTARELVIYAAIGLILATIAQVIVRVVLFNIGV